MTGNHTTGFDRPASGSPVTIVKLRPDGSEAIRYSGIAIDSHDSWVAARAPWKQKRVELGRLTFEPEDELLEFFSLDEPFNVFAIFDHDGLLKGWYSNVTHPSRVNGDGIYWHDLYLDVISFPDGESLVVDEDELADAGVAEADPELFSIILAGRDRLLTMVAENAYPFCVRTLPD